MAVLARDRKTSKLEFYMNARRLHKKILFLMVRDFGLKPRARQPTFYTRGWAAEDKELFEAITQKYGITRVVDDYPAWMIQTFRDKLIRQLDMMMEAITSAYTIWATTKSEADYRRVSQDRAIAACESLKQTFELIVDVLPVKAEKLIPYIDEINREIALLKGWRKADNKRNKNLK
ncbi:hypothetical protein LIQ46_00155 [Megasphaera elsdenii]|uniref:hypothetical protein n=1 Tax=Megasphaera TaxID=906 RepID=UPI001D027248|nr:hypothetical protein [Megasphaera elsdenii]MCB5701409.1 hypothetical protein [Megasphaera elsdenii]MCB5726168.1 hypothetical protein [Megasphaera elsdenii]MCB5770109.1 hypothetical protein [Megasphaera elsdenii]